MAFNESLKLSVKKRSHFSCCLCHSLYVEVHHIIPEEEGGPDIEDNAAPLCPSCHETYGANQDKRKFIREARDFWYELCGKRFASEADKLEEISKRIERAATKEDVNQLIDKITELVENIKNNPQKNEQQKKQELAGFTGMLGTTPLGGVSVGRQCKHCGTTIGLFIGDRGSCPDCGRPW
jgi:hypothetical protein